jgi:hypothetical protein
MINTLSCVNRNILSISCNFYLINISFNDQLIYPLNSFDDFISFIGFLIWYLKNQNWWTKLFVWISYD